MSQPAQDQGQERPPAPAAGERSIAISGDSSGIVSSDNGAGNVQMQAQAFGQGRVYQTGRDQIINGR